MALRPTVRSTKVLYFLALTAIILPSRGSSWVTAGSGVGAALLRDTLEGDSGNDTLSSGNGNAMLCRGCANNDLSESRLNRRPVLLGTSVQLTRTDFLHAYGAVEASELVQRDRRVLHGSNDHRPCLVA